MSRAKAMAAIVGALFAAGCGSSPVAAPSAAAPPPAATAAAGAVRAAVSRPLPARLMAVLEAHGVHVDTSGARASASVDGFRVHPDPDGDATIHVGEGSSVVVNATDIASRPPAPETYLVVSWGDGSMQRIGCGPCRLEHSYAPGRYTLEATIDDLQAAAGARAQASRAISLTVDVSAQREPKHGPFFPFRFRPGSVAVGDVFFLELGFPEDPTDIFIDDGGLFCEPWTALDLDFDLIPEFDPETSIVRFPLRAAEPGLCSFQISGTAGGEPFSQTAFVEIH